MCHIILQSCLITNAEQDTLNKIPPTLALSLSWHHSFPGSWYICYATQKTKLIVDLTIVQLQAEKILRFPTGQFWKSVSLVAGKMTKFSPMNKIKNVTHFSEKKKEGRVLYAWTMSASLMGNVVCIIPYWKRKKLAD